MDQSPAEVATITSIDSAPDWAGLPGKGVDLPRDALYALLGVTGHMHPRDTAIMTHADLNAYTSTWQVAGTDPTPGQWSQGGLWLGCAAWPVVVYQMQVPLLSHSFRPFMLPSSGAGESQCSGRP
eukprot:3241906-Amphidinium_carterae.2